MDLFTMEQIDYLDKHFDVRYNERFVHIDDCNDTQERINKKFANDDKRIEILSHRMNIWNKLLWTIATTSVGALVTSFLQLILK